MGGGRRWCAAQKKEKKSLENKASYAKKKLQQPPTPSPVAPLTKRQLRMRGEQTEDEIDMDGAVLALPSKAWVAVPSAACSTTEEQGDGYGLVQLVGDPFVVEQLRRAPTNNQPPREIGGRTTLGAAVFRGRAVLVHSGTKPVDGGIAVSMESAAPLSWYLASSVIMAGVQVKVQQQPSKKRRRQQGTPPPVSILVPLEEHDAILDAIESALGGSGVEEEVDEGGSDPEWEEDD